MIYHVVGYENISCVFILFDCASFLKCKCVLPEYFNNMF